MALKRQYKNSSDWHRHGQCGLLASAYFVVLAVVLKVMPELKGRLTYCCDCAIPFITAASNHGRTDLRCPFGCRETHLRSDSARRSQEYYGTKEGKQKKAEQNSKRSSSSKKEALVEVRNKNEDEDFENYLQMVMGFIRKRKITKAEVKERIKEIDGELRQHPLLNPWEERKIKDTG